LFLRSCHIFAIINQFDSKYKHKNNKKDWLVQKKIVLSSENTYL